MSERRLIVLIVGAEPEDRNALHDALSRDPARYMIIEAETSARAIDMCRERAPDCLILDHSLSGQSVLDALKQLAIEDGSLAFGVVVLVDVCDPRFIVEVMKSGAHDCLERDHAWGEELRRAVGRAIGKAERQRQVSSRERELLEKNRALEAALVDSRDQAVRRKQGEEARLSARAGVSAGREVVTSLEGVGQERSEEQLRLLKAAIEQSAESVIITTAQLDPPGPRIVYVNPAFTKMTGYTAEDVIGKTPRILQGPKTDRAELDRLRKDCQDGRVFIGETVNYRRDGSEFYIEWSVGPVRNERGEVTHFVSAQRDVTERRLVEDALRESETQFRSLFELSTIGMAQISRDNKFLRVNRKLCQMLGYSEQELLQLTFLDVTHHDNLEISAAMAAATFAGEISESSLEKRYVRKDGGTIWGLVNWSVIPDAEGRLLRAVASVQDITARKGAEEALRASEAQLRAIIDHSTAIVFVKDLEGRYLRVNRWYEAMHGIPEAEVKGKTDYDLHSKEIAEALRANDQEVISANAPIQFEERVAFADGLRHFVSVKFPLRDDSGLPYAVCGIATDITERKRMEQELRDSNEQLRIVLEAAQMGTFDWDIKADRVTGNERMRALLGLPREMKVTNLPLFFQSVVSPDDREVVLQAITCALERGEKYQAEFRVNWPDDGLHWVGVEGQAYYDAEKRPARMLGVALDITERKRAEEALRESEARLRRMADAMPQIVYTCDPDGRVDYINQQWQEYSGASLAQAIGNNWAEALHPDDRERILRQLKEATVTGRPLDTEYRLRRKDGQYRWHLSRALPIRDEQGKIVKWIGTSTDINDRKQAEAEREEMLAREQAARETAEAANRSKDEFLAVVSHELRSPLNAMLGYARLLRYGPVGDQKIEQAVEAIERSGKAQAQLIDDLFDTARIISGKLRLDVEPVDPAAIIKEAVQTIYPAADAKGISLQTDLASEVGQITGDPVRLRQIVWNLLSNAVKFTPAGGSVEVRLERIDPHVCILVSDTGIGISPDFLPYIFDRFRQADTSSVRRYGGLGLGLSLVKYLVELHGGTIEAASAGEGRGATFKVLLPVRAVSSPLGGAEVAPITASGLEESTMLAGVRVLAIDDEADARELVTLSLAQYGADVVGASSAAEAYELITALPEQERPDVMVIDLGMPDEDGYNLLRRVREWERERGLYTPAVALMAYGRVEDPMRALRAGFQMHIAKPVEPAELAIMIASLVRRLNRGENRRMIEFR